MALKDLASYEQLILVGALTPVATFAYKGKPVLKIPESCQVITLATVEHDLLAALRDLTQELNALSEPVELTEKLESAPPSGVLTAESIGKSLCSLIPENSILVDEGATNGLTIFELTKGARAHDYLSAVCGGAIGGGLPLALGASIACPDRKVIALQSDGSGMYTVQALWSMAREKADVIVIVLKNNDYAILEIELARVREGEANEKMQSLMNLNNPTLEWVKIAEGHGVPGSRAETADEFHQLLEAALDRKGPYLIEAQIAQNIQVMIDLVVGAK